MKGIHKVKSADLRQRGLGNVLQGLELRGPAILKAQKRVFMPRSGGKAPLGRDRMNQVC